MHTTNTHTTNRRDRQNGQHQQNQQNQQTAIFSTSTIAAPTVQKASPTRRMALRQSFDRPAAIALPAGFAQAPPVLSMSSKNNHLVCWLQHGNAIVSRTIGGGQVSSLPPSAAGHSDQPLFDLALKLLQPSGVVATGQPPSRRSRKLLRKLAKTLAASGQRLSLQTIQHHHAYVAACLLENHCPLDAPAVLEVALDDDHSEDGTLWGGEFFLADYRHCQRVGTFKPVSLLDDEHPLDRPWRNTYSHLIAAFDWEDLQAVYGDLELLQFFNQQPRSVLSQLLIQRVQAPLTSSVSRLFDAVAAAIGICRNHTIQTGSETGSGSAALSALIQSEHLEQVTDSAYRFELKYLGRNALPYLESRSMWQALLEDLLQNTSTPLISARFHVGLSQAIGQMVSHLQGHHPFQQVALTGRVFQNPVLLQQVTHYLSQLGLTVLTHRLLPCRDTDLLLGQAAIAAARSV
jgi:hydrogenase maturation protein HypF